MALRRNADRRAALRRAVKLGTIVRVSRGSLFRIDGYVLDVGEQFAVIQIFDSDLDLDGYQVVRVRDVTSIEHSTKRCRFFDAVLARRGGSATRVQALNLDAPAPMLESAQDAFGLLVVHRERLFPDVCDVGTLRSYDSVEYDLRYVTPDAEWDDAEYRHGRLRDITRVEFANCYETALAVMLGLRAAF